MDDESMFEHGRPEPGGDPRRSPRRGVQVQRQGDEITLVGDERSEQLGRHRVVELSSRTRDRTLSAFYAVLAVDCVQGALAVTGLATGWFDPVTAQEYLAITLSPVFAAWLVAARWAFPRRDGGRG